MSIPRFSFNEPARESAGDRLLNNSSKLTLEIWRTGEGRLFGEIEVKACLGRDIMSEDETDGDALTTQDENAEAMAFVKQVLGAFTAGKDGSV